MYEDSRRPQEVKAYTKEILAPLMYEAYSSPQSNWPDWSAPARIALAKLRGA